MRRVLRVQVGSSQVLLRSGRVLGRSSRVLRGSSTVLAGIVRVLDGSTGVLVHAELRRRHPGAEYFLRVDVRIAEREATQSGPQLLERQTGVEERAERHVARDAREAIEVQHAAHKYPASLKLQYRTSPSTT